MVMYIIDKYGRDVLIPAARWCSETVAGLPFLTPSLSWHLRCLGTPAALWWGYLWICHRALTYIAILIIYIPIIAISQCVYDKLPSRLFTWLFAHNWYIPFKPPSQGMMLRDGLILSNTKYGGTKQLPALIILDDGAYTPTRHTYCT